MRGFVWSQFRFRRSRTGALALAILVAAVSFTLLTASAKTSSLHVHGTLKSSFRPAYDILVRPPGSQTALERSERLVRPNFLAGVYGGISFKQWHRIEHTPGDVFKVANRFAPYVETGPHVPTPLPSCAGFFAGSNAGQSSSPFSLAGQSSLGCFPARLENDPSPGVGVGEIPSTPTFVGTGTAAYFPLYLTAIDPVQEAKLIGLDRMVVHGRYLRPNEGLGVYKQGTTTSKAVPVLVSARTYVDERLQLPPGTNVPRALSTGACRVNSYPCSGSLPPPAGSRWQSGRAFVESLPGRVIDRRSVPIGAFYRHLLKASLETAAFGSAAYWTSSPTRYRRLGLDKLAPLPVRNPTSVWTSRANTSGFWMPPYDNLDRQFRRLQERVGTNLLQGNTTLFDVTRVVGEFDPAKLPSFSPLSKVPLETYAPPELRPGSRAADHA